MSADFDFDDVSLSVDKEEKSVASVLSLLIFSSDSKHISPALTLINIDSLVSISLLLSVFSSFTSSFAPLLRRPEMIPETITQKERMLLQMQTIFSHHPTY